MLEKQRIRRQIKALVKSLSVEERHNISLKVMTQLEADEHFATAQTVVLFSSLPDEVETESILRKYGKKKQLLLPVVYGNHLRLSPFNNMEEMKKGAFNILEPLNTSQSAKSFLPIDLIIVPGVAFDKCGHRLGRGKGYYDRLLASKDFKSIFKIGICLPCQIVDSLPVEPHDVPMDRVITTSTMYF